MPQYFFHLHTIDGITEHDEVGHELANEAAAIDVARALADEAGRQAKLADEIVTHIIEVFDARGRCIHRIECKGASSTSMVNVP